MVKSEQRQSLLVKSAKIVIGVSASMQSLTEPASGVKAGFVMSVSSRLEGFTFVTMHNTCRLIGGHQVVLGADS